MIQYYDRSHVTLYLKLTYLKVLKSISSPLEFIWDVLTTYVVLDQYLDFMQKSLSKLPIDKNCYSSIVFFEKVALTATLALVLFRFKSP